MISPRGSRGKPREEAGKAEEKKEGNYDDDKETGSRKRG